jgi:hypothetical protein
MSSIKENKYHSTVKLEFRGVMGNIVEGGRTSHHMYTIHRLLSLGLLIDFTYEYIQADALDQNVYIEMDMKNYGKACFRIDPKSNYGEVADQRSREVFEDFLDNDSTDLGGGKGMRGFLGFDK